MKWTAAILCCASAMALNASCAAGASVNPKDPPYNAKGDGRVAIDCSMTSGSTALACSTDHFSLSDVGTLVAVYGAGPTTNGFVQPLSTTIASFTDARHVTLAASAGNTVTGSERVVWGTNDTAAIQAAVDALAAGDGLGRNIGGVVEFPPGLFLASTIRLPCGAIGTFAGGPERGICTQTYHNIWLHGSGLDATTIENWDTEVPSGSAVVWIASMARASGTEPGNASVASPRVSDLTIRQVKYPSRPAFILRADDTDDFRLEGARLVGSSYEGVVHTAYDARRTVISHVTLGPCGQYGPVFSGHGCLNLAGRDWIVESSRITPTRAFDGDQAWCAEMASYRGIWRDTVCDQSDFPPNRQAIVMNSSVGGLWDTVIENSTFLNGRIEAGNVNGIASGTTVRGNRIVNGQVIVASGGDRNAVTVLDGSGLPAHRTSTISDNLFLRTAFGTGPAIQAGDGTHGLESLSATGNKMIVTSRHFSGNGMPCQTDADPGGVGFCGVQDMFYVHSVGASLWRPSTAYAVGAVLDDHVLPTVANGYQYRVQVAGTSGASEPAWPVTIGGTVVDGTVRWVNDGSAPRAFLANNSVLGPSGTTASSGVDITTYPPATRASLTIVDQAFTYGWRFQLAGIGEGGGFTVPGNVSFSTGLGPWD